VRGLIYTNIEKCIGCNRCIDNCPTLTANVSVKGRDDSCTVWVDGDECNLCGMCLDNCSHAVREYQDDCDEFFAELGKGVEFSVIVAPSFYINYPTEYKQIFGYLKNLGVKDFYSASFGADITVWGYLEHLTKSGAAAYVSQPCPSIVLHIEEHLPELIPKLMPVQSPMMCTAIYLKKYLGVKEKLAFIGPCISKKIEILSKRGRGLISHNVTYKSLIGRLRAQGITLGDYPGIDSKLDSGRGRFLPSPGGLRENIEFYWGGQASVISVEGELEAYRYLNLYAKNAGKQSVPTPLLIDILSCSRGCVCGTGTEFRNADDFEVVHRAIELRREKFLMPVDNPSSAQRLAHLNERFKDLCLDDFKCEYEPHTCRGPLTVSDAEVDKILERELYRLEDNNKYFDCSACGYNSCRDMAKAIALGINHRDNCVYYVKHTLDKSTELIEQRLTTMLDASPMLCTVFNENGEISDVNNFVVGFLGLSDKQEFIDRFFDFSTEFQPDGIPSRKKLQMLLNKLLESSSGKGYVPEWTHVSCDGEIIPVEVFAQCVELGTKRSLIAYARDLRDERKMLLNLKSALEREMDANNRKTKFLSSVSHELRTPMNSVLGIAQLQLQNGVHSPETEEAFSRIYSASKLLLSIINDILDVSMVEAGKIEIINKPYDTASLIGDTVSLNLMTVGNKDIEFILDVDENLPEHLIGDEIRVKQVLNNVISNAIKYTAEGFVKLSFSMKKYGSDEILFTITVSDSGQGMTKEQIDLLFGDEFTRFNLVNNRAIEGSGLGLVISHRFVSLMGGGISVKSSPGKGSIFIISLPQTKIGPGVLGAGISKSLQNFEYAQRALKKFSKLDHELMPYGKVLVVDDVESNIYVAKEFLKQYKIDAETAESGTQAVDKIKDGNVYDIIFMDHMMPEMDGVEATAIIRSMGYKNPIVALSANARIDSVQFFMDNGFSGFLAKPIDLVRLNSYLMRFIRDKQPQNITETAKTSAQAPVYSPVPSSSELPKRLVDSFLRDAVKSSDVLESLFTEQSFDEAALKSFTIRVHAMKSALLNIGMAELSKAAEALETASRSADTGLILEKTPEFLDSLRDVIKNLGGSHEDKLHDKDDGDADFLRKQLLIIERALNSYDINTADTAIEALRNKKYSIETMKFIDEITDYLLCSEFEKAVALIRQAI